MDMEALLGAFLSADNAARRGAEAQLAALEVHRDDLPTHLLLTVCNSTQQRIRLVGTVLLRKVVTKILDADTGASHWDQMSAVAQENIKSQVLVAVENEPVQSIRLKIADTTSEIAMEVFATEDGTWPGLWAKLHEWVTGTSPLLQEASLSVFASLGEHIAHTMQSHFPAFVGIFTTRLTDATSPLRVRTAAAHAAVGVLISLPPRTAAVEQFIPLLPHIMNVFMAVLAAHETDQAEIIISILIDVVDAHATAFKSILAETLQVMSQVVINTDAPNEVRRMSLEFLVTFAEKAPGLARKIKNHGFLNAVLPGILGMMLEHGVEEPTLAEWEASAGRDAYEDGEGCNIPVAEEALDRIGGVIGAKHVLPILLPMIGTYLASADAAAWKYRFAGLSALSQVSDLLDDTEKMHVGVTAQFAPMMDDPSPRVRHAVLGVIGNLSFEQEPLYQLHTHATVMPLLIRGLSDASVRVRAQAAMAITAFVNPLRCDIDTDKEVLEPYLDAALRSLFGMLSGSEDRFCREQAITTMSALAEAAPSFMPPYYDIIIPGVKLILAMPDVLVDATSLRAAGGASLDHHTRSTMRARQAEARHVRIMKGRALECLTVVGAAVGPDRFRPDATMAMSGIVAMIAQMTHDKELQRAAEAAGVPYMGLSPADDPVPRFMWEAVGRIARTLGAAEFAPYLSVVLPPLVEEVERKAELILVNKRAHDDGLGGDEEEEGEEEEDDEDGQFTHMQEGRQQLKVRTAALEDKCAAIVAIRHIAEHSRGVTLAPFVPTLSAAIMPLLQTGGTPFDEIRAASAAAIVQLLASNASALNVPDVLATHAALMAGAEASTLPHVAVLAHMNMLYLAVYTLLEACVHEREHDQLVTFVTCAMHAVLEACAVANITGVKPAYGEMEHVPLLTTPQLSFVTQSFLRVRQEAVQRRSVRVAELKVFADDYDDDAVEDMRELDNEDAQLMFFCVEALGALIKTHRLHYLPVYCELVAPVVADLAHPAVLPSDRRLAVFLIVDALEFWGDQAVDPKSGARLIDSYIPTLLSCTTESHDVLRQAALYGLGAVAAACPETSLPYIPQAVAALLAALNALPVAQRTEVEDNAVTALGKIIIHSYASAVAAGHALPSRSEIVTHFLLAMPLRHDRDEARVAIQMLCTWIDMSDADVMGAPGAVDTPRLAHVLHVLAATLLDRLTCTDALRGRIVASLQHLRTHVPAAELGGVWGTLSEKDRNALMAAIPS